MGLFHDKRGEKDNVYLGRSRPGFVVGYFLSLVLLKVRSPGQSSGVPGFLLLPDPNLSE